MTNSGVGKRPTVGLKPAELVREYLRVASSGDPDMARPWVVPNDPHAAGQLQAWTRRRSALVYSNPTPRSANPSGKGEVKVVMEVSLLGHFDGHDWTPLAEERRLEFRLRRVGTEWRVANPGDEPLMSEESFKERFRRTTLYMVARDRRHLVPAPTFFAPDTAAAQTDERGVEARAEQVLRLLLDGPRGRLAPGITSDIPAGTRLQSFDYAPGAGLATVNLSSEFTAPGEAGSGRVRVAQVVCTLTELIRTAQVRIQVDGHEVDTGGTGSDLELWTASASGAAPARTGLHGNLSEPTWVPSDPPRLLTLEHDHGKVRLWSVAPDGDSRPVRLSLGRLPAGMDPTLLRVSADGGLVLAVMGSREQAEESAAFGADSDQLFLGVLGDGG